ncbi:hypothetical protein V5O48_011767 [Marasmius crinis-equi]|uniref:Uncharacterized protein n=1 Tax=Marasmius crinis-equi TaxID=585013 RepID=A0ABR3F564_9AGAR
MSSSVRTKNVTFDNTDFTNLKYGGFWFHNGTWNASSVGQTGTLSSTNDINANVNFTFPQPAIAFYYLGIQRSRGGLYSICIDCDPNAPNFEKVNGVNRTDDGKNPPVVLFSRVFDQPRVHFVTLKNENDTRIDPSGNSQLTVDGFVLEVVDDSPAATSSQSPTSTSPSPTSSQAKSSTPIGAIVGGAVGGFLAAVILIGIGLYCWHRKRRKVVDDPFSPPGSSNPFPSYITGHTRDPTSTTVTLSTISPSLTSSAWTSTASGSMTPTSSSYSSRTRSTTRTGSTQRSSARRSRRERRREMDAGPVLEEDVDGEEDEALPPLYEQVFRSNGNRRTSRSGTVPPESSTPREEGASTRSPTRPLPSPGVSLSPEKSKS